MELFYEGLRFFIPDNVYEPSEDSFMLANGAKLARGFVLDVGCGCGLASLVCAKNEKNKVLGTDLNPDAVRCAIQNAQNNNIKNVSFLESNLFSNIPKSKFDAILFNPPYLPTEYNERIDGQLNIAFDGGKDGRKVLDLFLAEFDRYLKPEGSLFLLQSTLNGPRKTRSKLKNLGYSVIILEKKRFFFESIYLFKASRISKP